MNGKRTILSIAVGCLIAPMSALVLQARTVTAASKGNAHAGEQAFGQYCMQCHSVYEGQGGLGPNLYAEMRKPHPKKTDPQVREILKKGKGVMPSFDGRLTPADTDNLIAYLHTL